MLPGQYVRVRLHVAELDGALLVPQAAVGSNQIGKFVYVIDADNKAVLAVGAVLLAKSTLVAPTDVDAVSKLLNTTVAAAKTNVDSGNASANACRNFGP